MPRWARLLVGFATIRAALILALYSAPPEWLATRPVPPWVYAYLAVTFIGLGVSLVVANLRDARAAWLGGIFTLIGSPFATALVDNSHAGNVWLILSHARPEPFIGLFLWHFLTVFPTNVSASHARIMRAIAAASGGVGLWCAAAMLASVWRPVGAAPYLLLPGRTDLYWLIVLAIPVPALAVLVLRSRAAEGAAEQRARLFTFGLVAGIAPFTLEVLVENLWPSYKAFAHSAPVQPWIGAVIFGALAIVPFVTAYCRLSIASSKSASRCGRRCSTRSRATRSFSSRSSRSRRWRRFSSSTGRNRSSPSSRAGRVRFCSSVRSLSA